MKNTLRAFVVLAAVWAASIFPWRLTVLATEALYLKPGFVRTSAGSEWYWEAQDLEQRLRRFGWSVSYVPNLISGQNAYGMTRFYDRSITIDQSLSWDERYVVLCHEGAHTLAPLRLSESEVEVFVESVAALMHGTRLREHARYLAALKPAVVPTLLVHGRDVYRVAAILQGE